MALSGEVAMRPVQAWLGLLLIPVSAFAADLRPFTATYDFNLDNKLSGKATRVLSRQGDLYHYEFRASATFASAIEASDFSFDGKHVRSQSYRNRRQLFFHVREDSVAFDWPKMTAHVVRKGIAGDYALQQEALDPLNLEVQLRQMLMSGVRQGMEFQLADPKNMHPEKFVINGAERIRTPYGVMDTIMVKRANEESERQTQFWLAPSLDYLPVRFVQKDDGAVSTLTLSAYQAAPVTPPPVPAAAVSQSSAPAR